MLMKNVKKIWTAPAVKGLNILGRPFCKMVAIELIKMF